MVVDSRWVRVGSSNLNPASLIGNYELDVLVEEPSLADALERQFRLDIARASEVLRRPVRGPARLSQRLPAALMRELPADHPHYQATPRERRRRATIAFRLMASHARRSVFLPAMVASALLALFFIVLPRFTAALFAFLCIWLAVATGLAAFQRRADR
jgi:cardiolipin synthase